MKKEKAKLHKEAKKYKTADEFIEAQILKKDLDLNDTGNVRSLHFWLKEKNNYLNEIKEIKDEIKSVEKDKDWLKSINFDILRKDTKAQQKFGEKMKGYYYGDLFDNFQIKKFTNARKWKFGVVEKYKDREELLKKFESLNDAKQYIKKDTEKVKDDLLAKLKEAKSDYQDDIYSKERVLAKNEKYIKEDWDKINKFQDKKNKLKLKNESEEEFIARNIYNLNKEAKKLRNAREEIKRGFGETIDDEYYERDLSYSDRNKIFDKLDENDKYKTFLYELKDKSLKKLLKETNSKPLGYHSFVDMDRDYYEVGGYGFHLNEKTAGNKLGEIDELITSMKKGKKIALKNIKEILGDYLEDIDIPQLRKIWKEANKPVQIPIG